VPYSGSAIVIAVRFYNLRVDPAVLVGVFWLVRRWLDTGTAAFNATEGLRHEHSARDPGPDSTPDIVRPNPADGMAVAAAVQGTVMDVSDR